MGPAKLPQGSLLTWSPSANSLKLLAGEPGFEPGLTESESVVLPLNYSPTVPHGQRLHIRNPCTVRFCLRSAIRYLPAAALCGKTVITGLCAVTHTLPADYRPAARISGRYSKCMVS